MTITLAAAGLCVVLSSGSSGGLAASTDEASRSADELFQAQDWRGAAKAYQDLVRASPNDAQAHFRLGVSLHGLSRYAEAAAALETAERLDFPGAAAPFRLAKAYARVGRVDDAVKALLKAAEKGFFSQSTIESDADLLSLRSHDHMAEVREAVDRNARPCAYTPEYRALDFWVGEWDVLPRGATTEGTPASRSRIERVEDQCVIYEQYTTAGGYSGRSFNSYNPETKRWEQFWVDNKGAIHHYIGEARDGNVYYEADGVRVPGTPSLVRMKMTFFNQGPDEVRQLGEQSGDGGETYSTQYDLIYRRRKPAATR